MRLSASLLTCLLTCLIGATSQTDTAHAQGRHSKSHGMDHSPLEMPAGLPVPQLELALFEDNMSGYNLEIRMRHFQFQPPQRGTEPLQELTGHAHRGWMANGRELLATLTLNTEQAPLVRHHISASPLQ